MENKETGREKPYAVCPKCGSRSVRTMPSGKEVCVWCKGRGLAKKVGA